MPLDPRRQLARHIRRSMRDILRLDDEDLLARHDRLMDLKKKANAGDREAYRELMNIIFGPGAA